MLAAHVSKTSSYGALATLLNEAAPHGACSPGDLSSSHSV